MSDPLAARRPVHLAGRAGIAFVLAAALIACSSAATTPPSAAQATASPAAIVSEAPAVSANAGGASASPAGASLSAAASPTASSGPGRYGGGGATATPTPEPTPKVNPKPTPKPTPKPASIVVKSRSTGVGTVLVGPNGLTLYTLKSDPTNGSRCTGDCAANWPPFLVKLGTLVKGGSGVGGSFSTFARGGKRQVTYKGRALYYFAGDSYAGDTNGQGINNVWYVAKL